MKLIFTWTEDRFELDAPAAPRVGDIVSFVKSTWGDGRTKRMHVAGMVSNVHWVWDDEGKFKHVVIKLGKDA